jgi:uncharacterized protein (DUF2141 family)
MYYKKISILIVVISSLLFGQDGTNIDCVIKFEGDGKIYVFLLTKVQFAQDMSFATNHKIILPDKEQKKNEMVSVSFTDIQPGTYAIRSFQDKNDNKKLDIGILKPVEPWGMSKNIRPLTRGPKFEEVCFEVSGKNMQFTIELKK